MKQFWKTDEHGNRTEQVECAYLDGYAIGERVLEGMAIRVVITSENEFKCEWLDEDYHYTKTLNSKYWLKQALQSCGTGSDSEFYSSQDLSEPDVVCEDDAEPKVDIQPSQPARVVALTPFELLYPRRA